MKDALSSHAKPQRAAFFAPSTGIILGATLILAGCSRPPAEIPDSPPEAIQTVLEGLSDNQPQVLWEAMPASYQADLKELRSVFCTHMDAELYDKTFRILEKAAKVLDKQEDYIFNSPMALNTPLIESNIGNHWDDAVGIMNRIVTSDVSTIEGLSQIDPSHFLASTGHNFMEDLQDFSQKVSRPGRQDPWEMLNEAIQEARIEFITSTNGQGFLKFTAPDNSIEEVDLTEVDGRWVPAELAASWDEGIVQAKEGFEKLSGPEFQKIKPILSMVLLTVEGAVDSLLRSRSQKEFDQTLSSLSSVGDMIKSLQPASEPGAQPE